MAEITDVRERVQKVEGQVTELTSVVAVVATDVAYLKERVEDLDDKFDIVTKDLLQLRSHQVRQRNRIESRI